LIFFGILGGWEGVGAWEFTADGVARVAEVGSLATCIDDGADHGVDDAAGGEADGAADGVGGLFRQAELGGDARLGKEAAGGWLRDALEDAELIWALLFLAFEAAALARLGLSCFRLLFLLGFLGQNLFLAGVAFSGSGSSSGGIVHRHVSGGGVNSGGNVGFGCVHGRECC